MPEGINPVTFTGKTKDGQEIKLSIGRLHIGSKDRNKVPDGVNRLEVITKNLTCVIWKQRSQETLRLLHHGEEMELLAELILDEDHFIRGLQHLFPQGELNL